MNIQTFRNVLVVQSSIEMAVTHTPALGGGILDGMSYVLLFLYHLKNDLCTLTYVS